MKKMKIEKQLIFADHVQQVKALTVSEHLTYRHEDEGIRAMGPLYIEGEYMGNDGIEKFRETLEMDVLAPKHKLNNEPFALQIEDYQAKANDDTIQVNITLAIQGLKDDKEKTKSALNQSVNEQQATSAALSQDKEKAQSASAAVISKDTEMITTTQDSNQLSSSSSDQQEEQTVSVDDFEDLFQDAESTYTSYRIIVAKPNDTYTAIADRYEVDEQQLRDTNKNKEILPKTLVILPFQ